MWIRLVNAPEEITDAARVLRHAAKKTRTTPRQVLEVFEQWALALHTRELEGVPGVAFLRLWLRRGTLEPILLREIGPNALEGGWHPDGHARLAALPLGVVGHWPAGNIEIQPSLSLSCALLVGNACLIRVPADLVEETERIIGRLAEVDRGGLLMPRIFLATFDHARQDLHAAMAQAVDGALVWGGTEAVLHVRSLPFPHWARVTVFGPRLSVAAMDADTWTDESARTVWCRRLARDVWQFDQQACTSPQTLFLEHCDGFDAWSFVEDLGRAFEEEERLHPRREIHPALTSAICQARASWLLDSRPRRALFPASPAWTILLGQGSDLPQPTQGRTLTVLEVEDLSEPLRRFDGTVQTLGLAIKDRLKENHLVEIAAHEGVDRIVKLGRMHVFSSPWDGVDLLRFLVRSVRCLPSED